MSIPRETQRGFSIIELMVVIAIIGILAALVLRGNDLAKKAARDAERIETVGELALLFELYKVENGRYPECDNAIVIEKKRDTAADFQNAEGAADCADLDLINAFFTEQTPGPIADPSGAGIYEHVYVYDGLHLCDGEYSPILFAKVEVQENGNAEEVCPQGGNDDGGYITSGGQPTYPYVIRLE